MSITNKYLEEFHIGDKFTTLSQTVTETDIVLFASITGDKNPVHTDESYVQAQFLGGRMAHGMLSASIAVGLWCRLGFLDCSCIAELESDWKFLGPVKIGDTIHADIEVIGVKRSASKPDRGVLTIQYIVKNQINQICQLGKVSILMYWTNPNK